jgi:hypothetical protein
VREIEVEAIGDWDLFGARVLEELIGERDGNRI